MCPSGSVYTRVTPTSEGVLAVSWTPSRTRSSGILQSINLGGKVRWRKDFPDFLTQPVVAPGQSIIVVDAQGDGVRPGARGWLGAVDAGFEDQCRVGPLF